MWQRVSLEKNLLSLFVIFSCENATLLQMPSFYSLGGGIVVTGRMMGWKDGKDDAAELLIHPWNAQPWTSSSGRKNKILFV